MAYRLLGVLLLGVALAAGCNNGDGGGPRGSGGTGGSAGSGGAAGTAGAGGTAGTGGSQQVECTTNVLCRSCPMVGDVCDSNDDCSVGSICIESGCDDLGGAPVKHCVFAGGGACQSSAMCPSGRECLDVPGEGLRCVKTTPGCDSDFDCLPGFACEDGNCADRRVPCDLDEHCPKNHVCTNTPTTSFCERIHVDCVAAFDCGGLAFNCEDIDGDTRTECAGTFDLNDPGSAACTNDLCSDGAAPVCEASGVSTTSQCGQYGLCLDDVDCATGFSCVALWADGRKECVPDGGDCASYSDCPVRQVCASPRSGGVPSCQVGYEP